MAVCRRISSSWAWPSTTSRTQGDRELHAVAAAHTADPCAAAQHSRGWLRAFDVQGCPLCGNHLAHTTHADTHRALTRPTSVPAYQHELRPANHSISGHQIARLAAPAVLSPCQWTALATSNAASVVESTERLPRKQTRCSKADECHQEAAACLHQHSSRTCSWRQLFIHRGCPSQLSIHRHGTRQRQLFWKA